MQRRFARAHTGSKPRARRHRGPIEAIAAVVIVAAALTAAALVGRTQGLTASQTPSVQTSQSPSAAVPAPGSSAALAAAAMTREQAAAWVAAQVDHGTIVSCDPLTCSALQQYRFPTANLYPITASSADPLGSGIVMSTAAVRNQLGGRRLNTVYAPLVLASFGTGTDQVQVRAIEVGGAPDYLAAVAADVTARTQAGNELTGNKAITEPATASAEMSSGHVDSRLLMTLAALTHKFDIRIVSFSDAGPEPRPACRCAR